MTALQATLDVVEAQPLQRYRCGLCGVFIANEDVAGAYAYCPRGHFNNIRGAAA